MVLSPAARRREELKSALKNGLISDNEYHRALRDERLTLRDFRQARERLAIDQAQGKATTNQYIKESSVGVSNVLSNTLLTTNATPTLSQAPPQPPQNNLVSSKEPNFTPAPRPTPNPNQPIRTVEVKQKLGTGEYTAYYDTGKIERLNVNPYAEIARQGGAVTLERGPGSRPLVSNISYPETARPVASSVEGGVIYSIEEKSRIISEGNKPQVKESIFTKLSRPVDTSKIPVLNKAERQLNTLAIAALAYQKVSGQKLATSKNKIVSIYGKIQSYSADLTKDFVLAGQETLKTPSTYIIAGATKNTFGLIGKVGAAVSPRAADLTLKTAKIGAALTYAGLESYSIIKREKTPGQALGQAAAFGVAYDIAPDVFAPKVDVWAKALKNVENPKNEDLLNNPYITREYKNRLIQDQKKLALERAKETGENIFIKKITPKQEKTNLLKKSFNKVKDIFSPPKYNSEIISISNKETGQTSNIYLRTRAENNKILSGEQIIITPKLEKPQIIKTKISKPGKVKNFKTGGISTNMGTEFKQDLGGSKQDIYTGSKQKLIYVEQQQELNPIQPIIKNVGITKKKPVLISLGGLNAEKSQIAQNNNLIFSSNERLSIKNLSSSREKLTTNIKIDNKLRSKTFNNIKLDLGQSQTPVIKTTQAQNQAQTPVTDQIINPAQISAVKPITISKIKENYVTEKEFKFKLTRRNIKTTRAETKPKRSTSSKVTFIQTPSLFSAVTKTTTKSLTPKVRLGNITGLGPRPIISKRKFKL